MLGRFSSEACPLCSSSGPHRWMHRHTAPKLRDFWRCGTCYLTFVASEDLITPEDESSRYLHHHNNPSDEGYRRFLSKLLDPLSQHLAPGARGLDMGCGPGPTVSVIMNERGFKMVDFDPVFAPDRSLIARGVTYPFVTCTEVLEHVRQPLPFLTHLDELLAPEIAAPGTDDTCSLSAAAVGASSVLGLMTGILEDDAKFPGWHYIRDITHIRFYRPETLQWVAERFRWTLVRPSRDVALFFKPHRSAGDELPSEKRPRLSPTAHDDVHTSPCAEPSQSG